MSLQIKYCIKLNKIFTAIMCGKQKKSAAALNKQQKIIKSGNIYTDIHTSIHIGFLHIYDRLMHVCTHFIHWEFVAFTGFMTFLDLWQKLKITQILCATIQAYAYVSVVFEVSMCVCVFWSTNKCRRCISKAFTYKKVNECHKMAIILF